MKIDVYSLLRHAPEHVLIKRRDNFPDYDIGQDMDIVVRDLKEMADYLSFGFDKIRVKKKGDHHWHIDIMDGVRIHLRFDLYSKYISNEFTKELFFRPDKHIELNVPTEWEDAIIKCYEYKYKQKGKYKEYATDKNLAHLKWFINND